jgi:hypothetical protein
VHLHRAAMIADPEFYYDYFTGLLRSRPEIRLTADVTPEYALLSADTYRAVRDGFAARRVRTAAVFLMRDPVDRIWSQIRMQEGRQPGRFDRPLDQVLAEVYTEPLYEKWSRYERTIANLDAVFSADDVHYGFYEQLFEEQQVRRICEFLGIDFRTPNFERKANESAVKAPSALADEVVAAIATHLRETYQAVAERFPDADLESLWPSSRFVL